MKEIPVKLWLFIMVMTVIKVIIASTVALGNDEVYYWTYALNLEWSYFDHPPFVAWLIRTTTANLYIHNELAVRLGAIISSTIGTIIVYKIGKLFLNNRVGWLAVLLYSSSFYCSIIAGTFILPDSPQMVFWLWSIFLLLKITKSVHQGLPTLSLWCWFGLAAGLCMMCKIHGIYLWVAVALFALFSNRKLMVQKGMYFSALISLIMVSPFIIWNIQHHFITYTYHSNRVSLFHAGINPLAFAREISGQIFYNNPIVFFLAWIAVFSFIKTKHHLKSEIQLLLYCALPLIATLVFLSIFRDTLPHWSGPAYSCLIFLSALKLEAFTLSKVKAIIAASMLFFLFVVSAGLITINFYKGTLSPQKDPMHVGTGDPTLDLYGWKETGRIVDSVYHADNKLSERNKTVRTIVITKWFPAAHLDFYVCIRTGLQTYGLGEIFDLHQYYWSNQNKQKLSVGDNAYYIVPSNLYDENSVNFIKSQFKNCKPPIIVPVFRNGVICKNILLFRLNGYKR